MVAHKAEIALGIVQARVLSSVGSLLHFFEILIDDHRAVQYDSDPRADGAYLLRVPLTDRFQEAAFRRGNPVDGAVVLVVFQFLYWSPSSSRICSSMPFRVPPPLTVFMRTATPLLPLGVSRKSNRRIKSAYCFASIRLPAPSGLE